MKHFAALLLLSASVLQAAVPEAEALNNRGVNQFQLGRYQEAEGSYTKAIAIWRWEGSSSASLAVAQQPGSPVPRDGQVRRIGSAVS